MSRRKRNISLQHSPEQEAERIAVAATGKARARDRGAALRSAQQEDATWRTRRDERVRRIQQRIESVTIGMVIGMCWAMLVLGGLAAGGLLLGMAFSSPGVGAPDWAHRVLSFGVVGLSVVGFLTLGLYGVGCALNARLRKWADCQTIDLDPPAKPARARRRRSRGKDG